MNPNLPGRGEGSFALQYGCHLSLRGGYSHAARDAVRLQEAFGLGCYQYFSKNPRGLSVKQGYEDEAEAARELCERHGIRTVVHTPYPTNLAVDAEQTPERFQATVQSLLNDLMIAEACGSIGAVVHFGMFKGKDGGDQLLLRTYGNIIRTIDTVLAVWNGRALLLLENQAGSHGGLGVTLEELVQIRQLSRYSDKIGYCFDTCHAFVSGLWDPSKTDELVAKGHELGYWRHMQVIHLNDSREAYASRQDRHANLGDGHIGIEELARLAMAEGIRGKPLILETPGSSQYGHVPEWNRLKEAVRADKK
ncbi:deoxyribonuclease IV [Paenibacillus melissococcoides]|uniref:Deoxyribonuclease IV n=1 Tax=Paenibacillus melissococcoides TaxID=2912268 RepID=A0ABM9G4U2_9BACL|nr:MULTISPECIES: deoxyribonuclease IV [Paenibacillus]MEB9894418.1 deoxyribonuclease IV [Bacillus cereus]CAH8246816.1 deoxyribonuclease IV [Paenibacillus melissococcoides]CAH8715842.1 deoxyribonuclease IV [Paenibacillus melissococcoides]CAH8716797.1 deoxyribonuclease IV [Paenibacillus melissococcoides]GIO80479.1 putative endonuclease 4 [Paenibacillus dendritiformis]